MVGESIVLSATDQPASHANGNGTASLHSTHQVHIIKRSRTADLVDIDLMQAVYRICDGEYARHASDASMREEYREKHPADISIWGCGDGRLIVEEALRMPYGTTNVRRNIGGIFDLGWPGVKERVIEEIEYTINAARQRIELIPYHYSASDNPHLGCAGHKCDLPATQENAFKLRGQFSRAFSDYCVITPVVVGFNTDDDSVRLYPSAGKVAEFDAVSMTSQQLHCLTDIVEEILPDTPLHSRLHLEEVIRRSRRHSLRIRAGNRSPGELNHAERILFRGHGPDLRIRNLAIQINSAAPLSSNVVGADVIRNNRDIRKSIPSDKKALFWVRIPFRRHKKAAIEEAHFHAEMAMQQIPEAFPELEGFFFPLKSVIDWTTYETLFL